VRAAQLTAGLGVVALVGKRRPDPGQDGEGGLEQALEQDGVVDIGRRGHAGDRQAVPVDRDVVLGPLLGPIGRVGAGQVAAALGPHYAAVHDQVAGQVRLPAQHADQHGMHMPQHARPRPVRQATPQGGPARLGRGRPQAAPRRALAQEPPQRRQHPHRLGRWVARTVGPHWLALARTTRPLSPPTPKCSRSTPPPRQDAADGTTGRHDYGQAHSTQGSSENRLLGKRT